MNDAELLGLERLVPLLRARIDGLAGAPRVTRLAGGASNLTFRLDYPGRSVVVRRPPPGRKAQGAHDMLREARVLASLQPFFPRIPEVLLAGEDETVMGVPFFVMDYLEGPVPSAGSEAAEGLDPATADALCARFVDAWVELHAVDVDAEELRWLDRGEGYVARQVAGWTRRYAQARTPDAAGFEAVVAWLAAEQPADAGRAVIHNDFRLDNLVLEPGEPAHIRGVLDWELATVGDPLMDLGASLAYWVEGSDHESFRALRLQPSDRPGMWSRRQLLEAYAARSGRRLPDFAFYRVYGLFRLAGIAQQIYYRHYHGQFTDARFAGFVQVVNGLEKQCLAVLDGAPW